MCERICARGYVREDMCERICARGYVREDMCERMVYVEE